MFLQSLRESKQELEKSLKNSKTNNELLNSELDHLRQKVEGYEAVKLVDKDKELGTLKNQIANVIFTIELIFITNLKNFFSLII